jgi:WD40 repeat protein
MPIAMNFDLLTNNNHQDRCEHLHEYETTLEIKLSKSPLSNGTNRQVPSLPPPPPVKPRLRPIPRIPRQINLEELSRCSLTRQFTLPNVENEKWLALASSNEYVLVGGGNSSTLRLFDLQGKEIRQIDIKTFAAFDLAWSNVLNAFLIAGYDSLQMYNVEKDQITHIENIQLVNKKDNYFWSIACHGLVNSFIGICIHNRDGTGTGHEKSRPVSSLIHDVQTYASSSFIRYSQSSCMQITLSRKCSIVEKPPRVVQDTIDLARTHAYM